MNCGALCCTIALCVFLYVGGLFCNVSAVTASQYISERNFKMEKKSNIKKIVIGIAGVLILALLCMGMWFINRSAQKEATDGEKSITVQIVSERDSYNYEQNYTTDEQYLGSFLEKENLIGFENSTYGRFIKSAQGLNANDEEQSWWCVMVNGESAVTGVDEIVIEDGAVYLLELKIGW